MPAEGHCETARVVPHGRLRDGARSEPRPAMAPIAPEEFKSVMRRFAAGVHVIGSACEAGFCGMTATAVFGVSADPPTLLIIVNRSNRSHPVIVGKKAFAVSVLSAAQAHIATHFASKSEAPFSKIAHMIGKTGCPIVRDADAYAECEVVQELDVATHTIFVGRIVSARALAGKPLLYHAGDFALLAPLAS